MTTDTLDDVKEALLQFLAEHPRNYGKAAKEFGFSREDILEYVSKHQEEFREVEEAFLDDIEEKIFRCAKGDEDLLTFSVSQATKLLSLQRPGKWSVKYVTPDDGGKKDKGRSRAQELVGKFFHSTSSFGGDVSTNDDGET